MSWGRGEVKGQGRNDVANAPMVSVADSQFWAAVDSAPPSIRRAMWETVTDWNPVSVMEGFRRLLGPFSSREAARISVTVLRDVDRDERQRFADAFEAEYRTPYPARAARSTVQRYERRA
jgi:uncharacterized membrane protein